MRVVIAGSSGLIGTALVAALRQAGHEVLRLVRREPAAADERGWDPPSGRLDGSVLAGVGAVVNLCGVGVGDRRWSGAYKQQLRDSRIEPTDVLARAVAEHRVPALVNASGINYYGDGGDTELDESAPSGGGFLAQLCRDWEAATRPASDAGARVVLLRSGVVLAPSGALFKRLVPLVRYGLGGRLGSGRQYLAWIAEQDEIAAIRFLLEHDGVRGPVNLTSPQQVTNAEFTRTLAAALHRPAPWVVPGFALRLVLGEFGAELLTSQRAVPRALTEHGFRYTHPSLRGALDAALGVRSSA